MKPLFLLDTLCRHRQATKICINLKFKAESEHIDE